ncbi:MAG: TolC family protein [Bdellovibrionota bacterium]
MRRNWIMGVLTIATAMIGCAPFLAQAQYTLQQSFEAARNQAETVAIQQALLDQAEERYNAAKGGLFPNLQGIASYTQLPRPSGPQSAFTRPDRPEVRLNATQAVFRGLREYAAIRQRRLDAEAQQDAKRRAELQLYQDLADTFFSILSLEQDLKNLETQIELNRKRVRELGARRRIGRSRVSEVLTVESAVASLEAQAASVKAELGTVREVFALLTGLKQDSSLKDDARASQALERLEHYLKLIEQRPDIQERVKRVKAAEEGIAIARGGHFPSIDLAGNYYLKRVGVLESQKWDFQAVLTLPIYSGGVIQSQLREASAVARQNDLELNRIRREAEREVRTHYQNVVAGQNQIQALTRATELAERNFREQSREYGFGLVTNLDVLQALNVFQESRRALDRTRYGLRLNLARLESAVALRGVR